MLQTQHFLLRADGRHHRLSDAFMVREAEMRGATVVTVKSHHGLLIDRLHDRAIRLADRCADRIPAVSFTASGAPARTKIS